MRLYRFGRRLPLKSSLARSDFSAIQESRAQISSRTIGDYFQVVTLHREILVCGVHRHAVPIAAAYIIFCYILYVLEICQAPANHEFCKYIIRLNVLTFTSQILILILSYCRDKIHLSLLVVHFLR